MQNEFFERVGRILEQARANAKTAVNILMVYAYYEIGKNIIEEEQNGKERADYGKYILKGLSVFLYMVFIRSQKCSILFWKDGK